MLTWKENGERFCIIDEDTMKSIDERIFNTIEEEFNSSQENDGWYSNTTYDEVEVSGNITIFVDYDYWVSYDVAITIPSHNYYEPDEYIDAKINEIGFNRIEYEAYDEEDNKYKVFSSIQEYQQYLKQQNEHEDS